MANPFFTGFVTDAGETLPTIRLTDDAAIRENNVDQYDTCYTAPGVDDAGMEYLVTWETLPEWDAEWVAYQSDPEENPDPPPEDEACDWEHPDSIERVIPYTIPT